MRIDDGIKKKYFLIVCSVLVSSVAVTVILGGLFLQMIPEVQAESQYPSDLTIEAFSGGRAPWESLEKIEINSNGHAVYSRRENRTHAGWDSIDNFTLSVDNLQTIWDAIQTNNFFNLAPNYTDPRWMDGSFCVMKITANGQTHTVRTQNIKVPKFDNIAITINNVTPENLDLFYNEIHPDIDPATFYTTPNGHTKVTWRQCQIKVDIYLEFYGPGVTQKLVNDWETGIETIWGCGGKYKYENCTVTFDVHTKIREATDNATPNYHQINVVRGPFRSRATKTKFDPRTGETNKGEGTWDNQDTPEVAAHEVGHLMGKDDTYKDVPGPDGILGTADDYSVPKENKYKGDIMAQTWNSPKPHPEHIEQIIKNSGQKPPKKLHGVGVKTWGHPVCTPWLELYPSYGRLYHCVGWEDTNGDNKLSPGDQINMVEEDTGELAWYHMDEGTVTIFVTKAEYFYGLYADIYGLYAEFEGGYEFMDNAIKQPISTWWYEVWPNYSKRYHLTSWEDTNEDGVLSPCDLIALSPSDLIDMVEEDTGKLAWYHVDLVDYDIIVRRKPPLPPDVTISPKVQSGPPGATLSYNVTVTNLGNAADNYTLSAVDNLGWPISISPAFLEIPAGESDNVTLSVTVHLDATGCMEDNITVTSTSQSDNTMKDNDSCIAHAAIVRGVDVTISPSYQSGPPGIKLTYVVAVKNTGNIEDNFSLENVDSLGWELELENVWLIIPPGENRMTTLGVTIPPDAASCTEDNVTVIAKLLHEPTVEKGASCIVHALEIGIPIPATIDIDPDTLNLKSKGKWITAYIELPSGYSVENIDVSTVRLIVDSDNVPAESRPTGIGDHDNDGIADLMVKFSRSAVQAIINVGEVELTFIGEVDGIPFEGGDNIRVINPRS